MHPGSKRIHESCPGIPYLLRLKKQPIEFLEDSIDDETTGAAK